MSGLIRNDDTVLRACSRFAAGLTAVDLPDEVRAAARLHLLDTAGVLNVGRHSDYGRLIGQALGGLDHARPGGAHPLGHPSASDQEVADASHVGESPAVALRRRSVPDLRPLDFAAMGGWIHGLEFDDTHLDGVVHVSSCIVPALACATASVPAHEDDVLAAYAAGVEVMAALGMALYAGLDGAPPRLSPTTVLGTCGAAVAVGRLMGLSAESLSHAQSFAASMAAGSLSFVDTGGWGKRPGPGWSAAAGVTAAVLAAHGAVGASTVYTGRRGLLAVLGTPADDPAPVHLGVDWQLPRTSFKHMPACHYTHTPAFLLGAASRELGIRDVSEIARLDVSLSLAGARYVCEPWSEKLRPRDRYDEYFSLPAVLAQALTAVFANEDLTTVLLTEAPTVGPATVRLEDVAARMTLDSPRRLAGFAAELVCVTTDGREWRGGLERPLPYGFTGDVAELVEAKYATNMAIAGHDAEQARKTRQRILALGLDGDKLVDLRGVLLPSSASESE